jgi:hypothetical protein
MPPARAGNNYSSGSGRMFDYLVGGGRHRRLIQQPVGLIVRVAIPVLSQS